MVRREGPRCDEGGRRRDGETKSRLSIICDSEERAVWTPNVLRCAVLWGVVRCCAVQALKISMFS